MGDHTGGEQWMRAGRLGPRRQGERAMDEIESDSGGLIVGADRGRLEHERGHIRGIVEDPRAAQVRRAQRFDIAGVVIGMERLTGCR